MLIVDSNEPHEILPLLRQSVPVEVMNLNQTKRSDFYFGGEDCKSRQFSRKQANEFLGNMDEAEDQIRDYYNNADENYQIIEGIISEYPLVKKRITPSGVTTRGKAQPGTMFGYNIADNGFMYGEHAHRVQASSYYAWIYRLAVMGVQTFYTDNYVATAKFLVAAYKNSQKPEEEHTTLQRYIRPRIIIRVRDPFIEALMGLSLAYRLSIGEDKATKIAEYYNDILSIAMAEVGELMGVSGIGKGIAEKLLTALGRNLDEED